MQYRQKQKQNRNLQIKKKTKKEIIIKPNEYKREANISTYRNNFVHALLNSGHKDKAKRVKNFVTIRRSNSSSSSYSDSERHQ